LNNSRCQSAYRSVEASQYRTTHVVSTSEAVEQRQLYAVLYAMGFRIYGEDLEVINKLTELLMVKKHYCHIMFRVVQ